MVVNQGRNNSDRILRLEEPIQHKEIFDKVEVLAIYALLVLEIECFPCINMICIVSVKKNFQNESYHNDKINIFEFN